MASSLDLLSRDLVGVNGMVQKECKSEVELMHIDENSVDNLRVSHMEQQFQLLLRKGVYPYEYKDNWEEFRENHLPPINAFYNKLSLSEIGECNYNPAQRV